MASPRSLRTTIFSKIRRCASLKKSRASISSAAWLKASLWSRIAPSTDRSASRLCGSARSTAAVSGMAPSTGGLLSLFQLDDLDLQLRGDVPVELHRHRELAELLERLVQVHLALLD